MNQAVLSSPQSPKPSRHTPLRQQVSRTIGDCGVQEVVDDKTVILIRLHLKKGRFELQAKEGSVEISAEMSKELSLITNEIRSKGGNLVFVRERENPTNFALAYIFISECGFNDPNIKKFFPPIRRLQGLLPEAGIRRDYYPVPATSSAQAAYAELFEKKPVSLDGALLKSAPGIDLSGPARINPNAVRRLGRDEVSNHHEALRVPLTTVADDRWFKFDSHDFTEPAYAPPIAIKAVEAESIPAESKDGVVLSRIDRKKMVQIEVPVHREQFHIEGRFRIKPQKRNFTLNVSRDAKTCEALAKYLNHAVTNALTGRGNFYRVGDANLCAIAFEGDSKELRTLVGVKGINTHMRFFVNLANQVLAVSPVDIDGAGFNLHCGDTVLAFPNSHTLSEVEQRIYLTGWAERTPLQINMLDEPQSQLRPKNRREGSKAANVEQTVLAQHQRVKSFLSNIKANHTTRETLTLDYPTIRRYFLVKLKAAERQIAGLRRVTGLKESARTILRTVHTARKLGLIRLKVDERKATVTIRSTNKAWGPHRDFSNLDLYLVDRHLEVSAIENPTADQAKLPKEPSEHDHVSGVQMVDAIVATHARIISFLERAANGTTHFLTERNAGNGSARSCVVSNDEIRRYIFLRLSKAEREHISDADYETLRRSGVELRRHLHFATAEGRLKVERKRGEDGQFLMLASDNGVPTRHPRLIGLSGRCNLQEILKRRPRTQAECDAARQAIKNAAKSPKKIPKKVTVINNAIDSATKTDTESDTFVDDSDDD